MNSIQPDFIKFTVRSATKILLWMLVCFGLSAGLPAMAADCNLNGIEDVMESDTDSDGHIDACDNCLLVDNPNQVDSNGDGYGNMCDADFNNDGIVNFLDLSYFGSVFLTSDADADLNVDGSVNFIDLTRLREGFLQPPGPGLPEANQTPLADAGPDQSVLRGATVTLDGSNSSDGNGDIFGYSWTFTRRPAGSNTPLLATSTALPSFTPDSVGTYEIELVVYDGVSPSLADSVQVTVAMPAGSLPIYADWMQDIETALGPKKYRDAIIPGTHDSATSDISSSSPSTIDCLINNPDAACSITSVFPGAAKAQSQSVYQQLLGGIRYLDLRLCNERDESAIYACHSLRSTELGSILNQIDDFLEVTEKEIVYIDYRISYGLEDSDWNNLFAMMRSRFGEAMVGGDELLAQLPPGVDDFPERLLNELTFNWFWENNKRVIVAVTVERNDSKCGNDDISALRVEHLRAGDRLRIYDSAPSSTSDDWLDIEILRDIDYRQLNSLELSQSNLDWNVTYHGFNGLNGKVSTVLFDSGPNPNASGLVRMYKGPGVNEPTLDCELQLDSTRSYNFTQSQPTSQTRVPFPVNLPQNDDIWNGAAILYDNNHSFANTSDLGTLVRKINSALPDMGPQFHMVQGQMTPGTAAVIGGTSLLDLAVKSNPTISSTVANNWRDDSPNIVILDYYEITPFIHFLIDINSQPVIEPGVPGFQFFTQHDAGDGNVRMKGDLACSKQIGGSSSGSFNFTATSNCDNDSADSGVFYDLQPGTTVRVFDNSAGSSNAQGIIDDDWLEIKVTEKVDDLVLDSFEHVTAMSQLNGSNQSSLWQTYENDQVRIARHGLGNLNDRVSRVEWSTQPTGPMVDFHGSIIGAGNGLCSIPFVPGRTIVFTTNPFCENDQTNSLVLNDLIAGSFIRIYDSSSGSADDDWMQIRVKQNIDRYVVGLLEPDINDSYVEAIVLRDNGLQGNVSRVEFDYTDELAQYPGFIEFFSQNGTLGESQCGMPMQLLNSYPLPVLRISASDLGCGNDRLRSMVLRNVQAGTRIQVCDSGGTCNSDDWALIQVLQSRKYYRINTFEQSFNDGVVSMTYSGGNGLDGKVSTLNFFKP